MAAFGGAGCLAGAARHICPLESPSSRVPAHANPIITKESVYHAIVAAARSTGPVRGSAFGRGGGPPPFIRAGGAGGCRGCVPMAARGLVPRRLRLRLAVLCGFGGRGAVAPAPAPLGPFRRGGRGAANAPFRPPPVRALRGDRRGSFGVPAAARLSWLVSAAAGGAWKRLAAAASRPPAEWSGGEPGDPVASKRRPSRPLRPLLAVFRGGGRGEHVPPVKIASQGQKRGRPKPAP